MIDQEKLRLQTKLAKALNSEYTYKDFAEAIEITQSAIYNWLQGDFNLSNHKAQQLEDIVINLIDEEYLT